MRDDSHSVFMLVDSYEFLASMHAYVGETNLCEDQLYILQNTGTIYPILSSAWIALTDLMTVCSVF